MPVNVFEVPEDFRGFLREVVEKLDLKDRLVDGDDAFQNEVGYGGRIEHSNRPGADLYRFHYLTSDGLYKWELVLREAALRTIADGASTSIEGTRHDVGRTERKPTGDPLLIWGECSDDALRIRGANALIEALDTLHHIAKVRPRMFRLWSAADDQAVAVSNGDQCALYVVDSKDGYATSCGGSERTDSFTVTDSEGHTLSVPFADCVPWSRARNALLNFVDHGNLGPEIEIEGRIPTLLLMMGEVDRKAALATRAEPPKRVARSSLPRMMSPVPDPVEVDEPTMPVEAGSALAAEWARRLLGMLQTHQLIELDPMSPTDEVTHQLGGLLRAHGLEAEHSLETADWLANQLATVRGISKVSATGGDLQIALGRTRK